MRVRIPLGYHFRPGNSLDEKMDKLSEILAKFDEWTISQFMTLDMGDKLNSIHFLNQGEVQ
jgi:hypothetical protein